jgi:alpha-N-arabinofuranosidase
MIVMAHPHPVNVHGCIKTTKTEAVAEVQALVLQIYRNHFGVLPVEVTGNAEPVDVAAAWTSDRKTLTVGIVNPTKQEYRLKIDVKGAQLAGKGQLWQIANPDPIAYNDIGEPLEVAIEKKQIRDISDGLSLPPLSANVYELPVR